VKYYLNNSSLLPKLAKQQKMSIVLGTLNLAFVAKKTNDNLHPRGASSSRNCIPSKHMVGNVRQLQKSSLSQPHRAQRSHVRAQIQSADQQFFDLTAERSALVNREAVLFLFQLEMDAQLQRSLTYENFDLAKEIRGRRQQVDQALKELQDHKGYGCGARRASNSAQIDFAPAALRLRSRMADAITEERYADAATLRDELAALEERAAEAEMPCPTTEPRFSLGQMTVHNGKGYRGIICGWDLACCESPDWQEEAGVQNLRNGADQVFYHVLVDVSDWPDEFDEPPVAYVAEELLAAASLVDFGSPEPLASTSFEHPYSYLMFLGSDGRGNMIPCRQLRDKYCVSRKDLHFEMSDDEEELTGEEDLQEEEESVGGGILSFDDVVDNSSTSSNSDDNNGSWGGGSSIPGIDMSSLE
jgi:hemimethylated DNA binding protein